jgi:hypothetical protein
LLSSEKSGYKRKPLDDRKSPNNGDLMNFIEMITREVGKLPAEAQAEVLDFVNFLVNKYTPKIDDPDEAWEQFSQHQALSDESPAETVPDYSRVPLKEDWR